MERMRVKSTWSLSHPWPTGRQEVATEETISTQSPAEAQEQVKHTRVHEVTRHTGQMTAAVAIAATEVVVMMTTGVHDVRITQRASPTVSAVIAHQGVSVPRRSRRGQSTAEAAADETTNHKSLYDQRSTATTATCSRPSSRTRRRRSAHSSWHNDLAGFNTPSYYTFPFHLFLHITLAHFKDRWMPTSTVDETKIYITFTDFFFLLQVQIMDGLRRMPFPPAIYSLSFFVISFPFMNTMKDCSCTRLSGGGIIA